MNPDAASHRKVPAFASGYSFCTVVQTSQTLSSQTLVLVSTSAKQTLAKLSCDNKASFTKYVEDRDCDPPFNSNTPFKLPVQPPISAK